MLRWDRGLPQVSSDHVELGLQLNAEPQAAYDTHLRLFDYEPRA